MTHLVDLKILATTTVASLFLACGGHEMTMAESLIRVPYAPGNAILDSLSSNAGINVEPYGNAQNPLSEKYLIRIGSGETSYRYVVYLTKVPEDSDQVRLELRSAASYGKPLLNPPDLTAEETAAIISRFETEVVDRLKPYGSVGPVVTTVTFLDRVSS